MSMNTHRRKLARQVCAILVMTSFVAAAVHAQPPRAVSTKSVGSGSCRMPLNTTRVEEDKELIRQFDEAWQLSGDGTSGRESVVLIFRMQNGSYTGKSQGVSNEYKMSTFRWNPAAIAIVHTHPNGCDPRPSENDQRIAEEYHVRMF